MKVVFFNRFFFPDASATSQILSDLAFHLAGHGTEVHVVTSRVTGNPAHEEIVRGVHVHRVAAPNALGHGLPRRARAYLGFLVAARSAAGRLVSRGDIVVAKTDPPLLSACVARLVKARGARLVVWLQDLFPEVAREYGVIGLRGLAGPALRRVRDTSLARADAVVAICDAMAERVRALECVAPDRLHVIHNWADGMAIRPIDGATNPLRGEWGLADEFVVAYSGNLGRVHEFETLLDAALRLRGIPGLRFVVIGHGPRLEEVRMRVARDGIDNVLFRPPQERDALARSLGVGDLHVSVLQPRFEGLVHPSKLYGIMAAGRPTLFVGSPAGETARILSAAGAGVVVSPGDGESLAREILALRDDRERRIEMGRRARRAFEERYDMALALRAWTALLEARSAEAAPRTMPAGLCT
jgi:glycosyltransferase involved in cell wall biosynthesis